MMSFCHYRLFSGSMFQISMSSILVRSIRLRIISNSSIIIKIALEDLGLRLENVAFMV